MSRAKSSAVSILLFLSAIFLMNFIFPACQDKAPEETPGIVPQPEAQYIVASDNTIVLKGTGFQSSDTFRLTRKETGIQTYIRECEPVADGAKLKLTANFATGNYEIVIIKGQEVQMYGEALITNPKYTSAEPELFYLTSANHPRLLLDDDEFSSLKTKISSGNPQVLVKLHENVMEMAEAACSAAPLVYELDAAGKRLLSVSQAALTRVFSCAYAYRYTGNKKYLDKAETDLNTVCSFQDWNADTHYLDVAEMCTAVAFGYDWLHKDLKPETLKKIEKSVVDYAFIPADKEEINSTFYGKTTNWNQVCNGGLVCAALAIYETAEAKSRIIINNALSTNKTCMEAIYPPTGNYPEGYGYWGYGTGYEALMLSVLESATNSDGGLTKIQGFNTTAEWLMYMGGPVGVFNFGDNGPTATPNVATWYFAAKYNSPALLNNDIHILENNGYKWQDRLLPMVLAFASRIDFNKIAPPVKKVWAGQGISPVVLIRDGWNWNESDTYLAIKGGAGNVSHGHLDGGSFVYDYKGVRWAADMGPQTYATAEKTFAELGWGNFWSRGQNSKRWWCIRLNNFYHNTLTVNENLHKVSGVAKITQVIDNATEQGAVVDMTEVLVDGLTSAIRTIKYVNGRELVVTDDLKALAVSAANIRWTMLTPSAPEIRNDGILLTNNGRKMLLSATSSDGSAVTYKVFEHNDKVQYDHVKGSWEDGINGYYRVGFTASIPAGKGCVYTTKLTPVE